MDLDKLKAGAARAASATKKYAKVAADIAAGGDGGGGLVGPPPSRLQRSLPHHTTPHRTAPHPTTLTPIPTSGLEDDEKPLTPEEFQEQFLTFYRWCEKGQTDEIKDKLEVRGQRVRGSDVQRVRGPGSGASSGSGAGTGQGRGAHARPGVRARSRHVGSQHYGLQRHILRRAANFAAGEADGFGRRCG